MEQTNSSAEQADDSDEVTEYVEPERLWDYLQTLDSNQAYGYGVGVGSNQGWIRGEAVGYQTGFWQGFWLGCGLTIIVMALAAISWQLPCG